MHKIVIPDIHQQIDRLKSIIQTTDCQEAEEIIFLGDYFDSFDYDFYTPEMCDFLNKNIENEKYTFLLGNHDVHYLSSVNQYMCSGWNFRKQSIIDTRLSKDFKKKVKPFKYEKISGEHVLFSHAGLHPSFAPIHFDELLKTSPADYFQEQEEKIMDNFIMNEYDHIFGAGKDRGGNLRYGGITWLDWSNFVAIKNLNQIVGHSIRVEPQILNSENSVNINIDTNLKHYMKIHLEKEKFTYEIIRHRWSSD